MKKLGPPRKKQNIFLAFMLKIVSKIWQAEDVMSILQASDFHGITTILAMHAILQWPSELPSHQWEEYLGDKRGFPHAPLLCMT